MGAALGLAQLGLTGADPAGLRPACLPAAGPEPVVRRGGELVHDPVVSPGADNLDGRRHPAAALLLCALALGALGGDK